MNEYAGKTVKIRETNGRYYRYTRWSSTAKKWKYKGRVSEKSARRSLKRMHLRQERWAWLKYSGGETIAFPMRVRRRKNMTEDDWLDYAEKKIDSEWGQSLDVFIDMKIYGHKPLADYYYTYDLDPA